MLNNAKSGLSRLSSIGKALMLPISILPAAGLLLAFGAKLDIPLMMRAGGSSLKTSLCSLLSVPRWV